MVNNCYAYVTSRESNKVYQFTFTTDGSLVALSEPEVNAALPLSVTCLPDGKHVYVINDRPQGQLEGTASLYSVGENGMLKYADFKVFPGRNSCAMSIGGAGKYGYFVSPSDSMLVAYTIKPNGQMTIINSSVATEKYPVAVIAEPTGKYVYTINYGDNSVSQFSPDKLGILKPLSPAYVSTGANPTAAAIHPLGHVIYVANAADSTVSQYKIQEDGQLSLLASPVATGKFPTEIAVTSTGKYAYVTNYGSHSISQYAIGPDGAMQPLSKSLLEVGSSPKGIAIDPRDACVYVTHAVQNMISQFQIENDGTLKPLTPATIPLENEPEGITICVLSSVDKAGE